MIIPSIDLSRGKAVQLKQGREKVFENEFPSKVAEQFSKYGEIALIDLDAAFEDGHNEHVVKNICQWASCRVGGGIRTIEKAKRMISYGAEKVIIGTKAFHEKGIDENFLKALKSAIGKERIIIAVDSLEGEIVTHGWKKKAGFGLSDVLEEMKPYASEFLYTCVEKEGLMKGTDLKLFKRIRNRTDLQITAAGGISSLEEIQFLSSLQINTQLGMTVYSEKFSLADAFIHSLDWEKDLIPTIAIDQRSQVLMLAYSSRESLKKTFETGRAWYFSRSREKLWMKGETSGNVQDFLKIRTDCDSDALLLWVKPKGVSCHLGTYSCFGDRRFQLEELFDVIKNKLEKNPKNSYTAKLDISTLKGKIIEEAGELVRAEKKEDVIWEASDLMYFMSVLLVKNNIKLADILNELKRRRRISRDK